MVEHHIASDLVTLFIIIVGGLIVRFVYDEWFKKK